MVPQFEEQRDNFVSLHIAGLFEVVSCTLTFSHHLKGDDRRDKTNRDMRDETHETREKRGGKEMGVERGEG